MMNQKRNGMVVSALVLAAAIAQRSDAAILIDNIQLTSTSLSFDISGTVDQVGDHGKNHLYVGEPGNTSWVNAFAWSTEDWPIVAGSITVTGVEVNPHPDGNYAVIIAHNNLAKGDYIEGTFELDGGFNPGGRNIGSWIISAGRAEDAFVSLPDERTITGGEAPEPSSGLLALVLFAGLANRRRR